LAPGDQALPEPYRGDEKFQIGNQDNIISRLNYINNRTLVSYLKEKKIGPREDKSLRGPYNQYLLISHPEQMPQALKPQPPQEILVYLSITVY
jgi:hypothetical protein